MKFNSILATTLASLTSLVTAADLPAVDVVGNKFYFSNNGSQFLMRGIAYQQNTANQTDFSFIDPLADEETCKRDVEYFQELNTNTLRVYAVNASKDHDACMKIFNDAGIYIIADLSEPDLSVNRDSPEWNVELYERYTQVVDMFANYTNVLGFFAGNEVTNNASNTEASAFVKAAVRDTKAYIKSQDYRSIPVGYSSNDDPDTRVAIADYFACGEGDEKADFFGINMYEWCGESTFKESGFADRTEDFKNLSIPIFFSEYGCNEVKPRKFEEVGTLYSDDMTDIWSGGIVYMYFEEENQYGLVSVDGSDVKTLDDFKNYKSQINKISPSYASIASDVTTSSGSGVACPATSDTWAAATNLPPTPDKDTCDCIASSLQCVVDESVEEEDYASLFDYLCEKTDCGVITSNGSLGTYGGLSFCANKDKLSYVMNEYYLSEDKASSACDFDGKASINSKASAASSCSSKISSATQAVSSATSGSGSGSSSDSDSSSGSSSSGSGSSATSGSSSSGAAVPSAQRMGSIDLAAIVALVSSFIGGATFMIF